MAFDIVIGNDATPSSFSIVIGTTPPVVVALPPFLTGSLLDLGLTADVVEQMLGASVEESGSLGADLDVEQTPHRSLPLLPRLGGHGDVEPLQLEAELEADISVEIEVAELEIEITTEDDP